MAGATDGLDDPGAWTEASARFSMAMLRSPMCNGFLVLDGPAVVGPGQRCTDLDENGTPTRSSARSLGSRGQRPGQSGSTPGPGDRNQAAAGAYMITRARC